MTDIPLIAKGNLDRATLADQVAIVTGAGGGIGYEAARALAWLGARVVIAEVSINGSEAATRINEEYGSGTALYVNTDVGDERSIRRLFRKVPQADIIIHNATVAPLGTVVELPIEKWDQSYRVNLRGPVMLSRQYLPGMLERRRGVLVCVGSEGLDYMGCYESMKAAQLHLAHTLAAELEGTGVCSYLVAPGMAPTATAMKGVEELARYFNKPVAEMYALIDEHIISVEAAGAGFAASVVMAPEYHGQEVGVKQALFAVGIEYGKAAPPGLKLYLSPEAAAEALSLCREVKKVLQEQAEGWQERSVFERQWMLREFKKQAGLSTQLWLEALEKVEQALEENDLVALNRIEAPLDKLVRFYTRLSELAKGYSKDPQQLEEHLQIIQGWIDSAERLHSVLGT